MDTSTASAAVDPGSSKHAAVRRFVTDTPLFADQIFLSVVTLAEMQIGVALLPHRVPPPPAARIEEVERRVNLAQRLGTLLPITAHIAREHAALKAAYARKFAPNKVGQGKGLKGKPVELWHENLTASSLQVTENDLWIAATAIAHDLTLITADDDHRRMKEADGRLRIMHF